MIKSIEIRNFQSHKATELLLNPGVNVIVGLSDSGKSAIIRALRWLIYNRPAGDSFRSHWGGTTNVTVETDQNKVTRIKSKGESGYILQTERDKSDITFKAIGTDVPEEVKQALNFQDINLQLQLDKPFLLDNSPGEVAQHFNKIARLDVIDQSTQVVQRWIRELEQDIKSNTAELARAEESLKLYNYLPEMEAKVVALEQTEQKRNTLFAQSARIAATLLTLDKVGEEITTQSKILKLEPTIDQALKLVKEKDRKKEDRNNLDAIIYSLHKVTQGIKTYTEALGKKEREFKRVFPSVCPLCGQEIKK